MFPEIHNTKITVDHSFIFGYRPFRVIVMPAGLACVCVLVCACISECLCRNKRCKWKELNDEEAAAW